MDAAASGAANGPDDPKLDPLRRQIDDLDAQIAEFREVETQVAAELRSRGLDPASD